MLYPRIIPCLLVHNKGLVKTVKFKSPKYVGDPINAVRIFNEKEVDELIVLDIDASREGREPDYKMIENLALESRMPLCYGGGIKTKEQARKIISLGVEKIAISSIAISNPEVITNIAAEIGSQSVVVVIDAKKRKLRKGYDILINNASKNTKTNVTDFVNRLRQLGAGEVVINSIDNDGVMTGYDLELVKEVRQTTNLPLTILGGVGNLSDISELISEFGIIGAAAGSLFVFKGKYRAVLINYPTHEQKTKLIIESNYGENHFSIKT